MNHIIQKLTSRKLWAAVLGVLTGLAMVFGLDTDTVNTVSGAVVAVISVVTYITTEGRIDAAAVGTAAGKVSDAVERLK